MLLPMIKVRIVGPKSLFYSALNIIHYLGVLQIDDFSKTVHPGDAILRSMEIDDNTRKNRAHLERFLGRVTAIISAIESDEGKQKTVYKQVNSAYERIWRDTCDDLESDCERLVGQIEALARDLSIRKRDFERELGTLTKYQGIVEKLYPLSNQIYRLQGYEAVALLINKKYGSLLSTIREEIGKLTKQQYELVAADVDAETVAAIIIFDKNYSDLVHDFIWAEKVNQLRLPDSLAEKPFDQILDHIDARKKDIPQKIAVINRKLAALSDRWYVKLIAMKLALHDRIQELEVPTSLAQTDLTFVITGWLPRKHYDELSSRLGKEYGGKVYIEEIALTIEETESTPVVYDNPAWAKPFELVMGIFQPPVYGTIDPTPFMALFFPIFFGLIVGDIGTGLLLLAVTIYCRFRYKAVIWVKPVTTIAIMASLSAILFGFVYGELFGNILELNHLIREVHILGVKFPINRIEAMMPMLYLSLGIGAIQVTLGLVLGVINAIKKKAKKHLAEKGGMLLVLLMIFVALAVSIKIVPDVLSVPAYVGFIVGIVLLVYGGGFIGFFEIIGTIGNIFSYSRILAIGLAGMILAMVANQLAGSMGSIFVGMTVALLLHALNIILAAFSPTIHALRLNVVEFFKQFVEYGGEEYQPFKRTGGE